MLRKSITLLFAAVVVAGILLFNIAGYACTGLPDATEQGAPAPTPKRISTSDLKKLRWIEGTWRGTGDVEKPFFERYYFENESTLVVEGFSDETLSKVTDVTRFAISDGQFGNGGEGARWTATELDDDSITFEPVAKARNTFVWERQSKDVWKAVLKWPATASAPAKQRVYKMERFASPKQ